MDMSRHGFFLELFDFVFPFVFFWGGGANSPCQFLYVVLISQATTLKSAKKRFLAFFVVKVTSSLPKSLCTISITKQLVCKI